MTLIYLDQILRYISREEYTHRGNVPILLADYFEENPFCSLEEFLKFVKSIRNDFFRINRIDRAVFSTEIHAILGSIRNDSTYSGSKSDSFHEKMDELLKLSKENREDTKLMRKMLDEIHQRFITHLLPEVESMIAALENSTEEQNGDFTASGQEILQRIRQKILMKRIDEQIEVMKGIDQKVSRILAEVSKDRTKAQAVLRSIKELGVSITSETIAAFLLRGIGF